MRRLCLLAFVLLIGAGCASTGGKPWYDDALKDLRGDNMEMRYFKSDRGRDD